MNPGARALALTLSLAALTLFSGCGPSQAQGGPPMAPPVSAAPAVSKNIPLYDEFSGRLEAVETVELRSRVAGTLQRVHFRDGQDLKRGELMFSIDARPFTAELTRLEAQLAAARSAEGLAASELVRTKKLLEQKAVSQQEADQAEAAARNASAVVRAAEAAVAAAKLNVEYTQIRAPIAGRASRANVTAGNLVNEQAVLTTIAGVAKVHAYFDGSEQTFLRVKAAGEKTPAVRMALSNEDGYPHAGKVDYFDNRLNPQTGAIRMRASFDNSKGQFVPGLAVRLVMATTAPYSAVMVPERAIGTDQSKKFVVVVGADGKPQFRDVQLGALQDGMRVVGGGKLKAGENVVVDGLQRIIPGVPVAPQVLKVDDKGLPIPPAPQAPGAAPTEKKA